MAFTEQYDVVVVGAGHAGCEAAMAAARMGMRTALITMNMDLIAQMSCNPAVGGVAKGHLVREVDALGGIMGEVADAVGIQFRLLNTSRGPAVWSPRAQCDKALYRVKMREVLEGQAGLHIRQAEVVDLVFGNEGPGTSDEGLGSEFVEVPRPERVHRRVLGLKLRDGRQLLARRDPATGEKVFYGEFLINAQGEDVVAGVRTPEPVAQLKNQMPEAFPELEKIRKTLEKHFKDVQDFEFTIQDGKLFMLQTRNGKRTGLAAVRFAIDMEKEKLIDWKTAIRRVPADQLDQVLAPDLRSQGRQSRQVHRHGPARRSRRGLRQDLFQRRSRRRGRRQGREGAARPQRNLAGRFARHDRRRRHPHRQGRRQFARGARRPPDGQGLRLRRQRAADRLRRQDHDRRRRRPSRKATFLSIDGTAGEVYAGRTQDRRLGNRPGARREISRRQGKPDLPELQAS